MKNITIALVIIISALLQATVLNYFRLFGVKPDLLLVCVVVLAFSLELKSALLFAVLAGALGDTFSQNPFGTNTLLFPLWVVVIGFVMKKLSMENNLFCGILVFLVSALNTCVVRFIIFPPDNPLSIVRILLVFILGPLYSALFSPVFLRILK